MAGITSPFDLERVLNQCHRLSATPNGEFGELTMRLPLRVNRVRRGTVPGMLA